MSARLQCVAVSASLKKALYGQLLASNVVLGFPFRCDLPFVFQIDCSSLLIAICGMLNRMSLIILRTF